METAEDATGLRRALNNVLRTSHNDNLTLPCETVCTSALDGEHTQLKEGYLASFFDHDSTMWRIALLQFQWLNLESKYVATLLPLSNDWSTPSLFYAVEDCLLRVDQVPVHPNTTGIGFIVWDDYFMCQTDMLGCQPWVQFHDLSFYNDFLRLKCSDCLKNTWTKLAKLACSAGFLLDDVYHELDNPVEFHEKLTRIQTWPKCTKQMEYKTRVVEVISNMRKDKHVVREERRITSTNRYVYYEKQHLVARMVEDKVHRRMVDQYLCHIQRRASGTQTAPTNLKP